MPKEKKIVIEDYRQRYQDGRMAERYHEGYARKLGFKNYRMKVIAERERGILKTLFRQRLNGIQTLLDVPCGGGKISTLVEDTGFTVYGADISTAMLGIAHKNYVSVRGFRGLMQADATRIPLENEAVDCVVCLRLMHRLSPNLRRDVLSELVRVTSKYIVISYGVSGATDRFRRFFMKRNPKAPYHMAKRKDIVKEVEQQGLKVICANNVLPYLYYERIYLLEK